LHSSKATGVFVVSNDHATSIDAGSGRRPPHHLRSSHVRLNMKKVTN
jgi:hypothetical protein